MGNRVCRVNETEQLKAKEKEQPTNKVSGMNVEKNTEVIYVQRHSIFNHGVAMLCYICNANRRIFQVIRPDKMCSEWLVSRNLSVYCFSIL